jgi:hypothetical protein
MSRPPDQKVRDVRVDAVPRNPATDRWAFQPTITLAAAGSWMISGNSGGLAWAYQSGGPALALCNTRLSFRCESGEYAERFDTAPLS